MAQWIVYELLCAFTFNAHCFQRIALASLCFIICYSVGRNMAAKMFILFSTMATYSTTTTKKSIAHEPCSGAHAITYRLLDSKKRKYILLQEIFSSTFTASFVLLLHLSFVSQNELFESNRRPPWSIWVSNKSKWWNTAKKKYVYAT